MHRLSPLVFPLVFYLMLVLYALVVYPAYASIEAGGSYSDLDEGFDDWNRQYLTGRWNIGERSGLVGTAARQSWFDETDFWGTLQAYGPLTQSWEGTLTGGYSPTHEVTAEWWGEGAASYWMGPQTGIQWVELTGGGGFADYDRADDTLHLTGTLRGYEESFWAGYTFVPTWLGGEGPATSHQFQVGYQPSIGLKWGAGLTVGETITQVGAGQVQEVDLTSGQVWGQMPMAGSTALTYSLMVEDIDRFYTRVSVQVGLKWL